MDIKSFEHGKFFFFFHPHLPNCEIFTQNQSVLLSILYIKTEFLENES